MPFLRNPIFEREFVALCRTRKWFVVRTTLVGVAVLAIWIVFATVGERLLRDPAKLGQALFTILAVLEVLLVAAVTPALVADVLVAERRQRTLDVLLTTPIRPAGIVLGKALSRLALVLVIALAFFPMISVALLYGGVRGEQVLALGGLVLGTALFTGGIALPVSAHARRLGTAAVLSYVLPIAYAFLYPVVLVLAAGHGHEDPVMPSSLLVGPHPGLATMSVALDDGWREFAASPFPPWAVWLVTGGVVALLGSSFAILRIGRERHEAGTGRRRTAKAVPAGHRRRIRRMRRPLLWKETRLRNPTHSKTLFRIVLALLVLSEVLLFATAGPGLDEEGLHLVFATIQAMFVLLVVAVNASTCVVSERAQGTLDLVHVTLVRPAEVTLAKVAGTLRSAAVLVAFPCLHLFVAAAVSDVRFAGALAFTVAFLLLVSFFAVFGVGFSIVSKKPARAIVKSLSLFVSLLVGLPLAAFVFLLFAGGFGDDAALGLVLGGCPAVIPAALAEFVGDPASLGPGKTSFLTAVVGWSFLYLVATAVFLQGLGPLYERARRREQGGA